MGSPRFLFVCYHFPPMLTTGSFRPARFLRYFPKSSQVDVLTISNPAEATDDARAEDTFSDLEPNVQIHKAPVRKFLAKSHLENSLQDEGMQGWFKKAVKTVFTYTLWTPDGNSAWIASAYRMGKRLSKSRNYDAIFSSAPPPSAAIVGTLLSRKYRVPHVVDFRDPWTRNVTREFPSAMHRRVEERLERWVLENASIVIANTEGNRESLVEQHGEIFHDRIRVLHNGFDPERQPLMERPSPLPSDKKTLFYGGHLYHGVHEFFRALLKALEDDKNLAQRLELRMAGTRDVEIEPLIQKLIDLGVVKDLGFLPPSEVARELAQCDATVYLVHPEGYSWVPSKLFEYFLAAKPVLAYAPQGEAMEILMQSGLCAQNISPQAPPDSQLKTLEGFLARFLSGSVVPTPDRAYISRFSAEVQSSRLHEWLLAVNSRPREDEFPHPKSPSAHAVRAN